MNKVILLDCDETIWSSAGKDYISSKVSSLILLSNSTITRKVDNKIFKSQPGIKEQILRMIQNGCYFGIVSDNAPKQVLEALHLLGILKLLDARFIRIELCTGYCDKAKIVNELCLTTNISPDVVTLIDDKDYSDELNRIGATYIQTKSPKNTLNILKAIL